jgi:acetyl esterase/lipase
MPIGFLISVLIWALVTAAMLRPPRRPQGLARLVYFLSVLWNEVPLLLVASLVVLAPGPAGLVLILQVLLSVDGGQELVLVDQSGSAVGILALGVAVLAMVGLVVLQVRVVRSRRVVTRILGSDPGPMGISWLAPLPLRPRSVERVADVQYAPGGKEHRLDVYRRRDGLGGSGQAGAGRVPAPVLVYWHPGGYFMGGKRREARHLFHTLADHGWVVVSANYRLRPQAGFAEHLADAQRVVAWVGENAEAYGMDPSRVVVSGSSAGGHLSAHLALGSAPVPGVTLIGAVILYGYLGIYYGHRPGEHPSTDPQELPAHDAPPMLVVHGDLDTYVPVEMARSFVSHVRDASANTVTYVELPGAQHGFDLTASPRTRAVVAGVDTFLEREVLSAS